MQVDDRTDVRLQKPWDEQEKEWTYEEIFKLITLDGTAANPADVVMKVHQMKRFCFAYCQRHFYKPHHHNGADASPADAVVKVRQCASVLLLLRGTRTPGSKLRAIADCGNRGMALASACPLGRQGCAVSEIASACMSLKLERMHGDGSSCRNGAAAPESHLVGHAGLCVYAWSIMFQLWIMPQVEDIKVCRADLQELDGEYNQDSRPCSMCCCSCFN